MSAQSSNQQRQKNIGSSPVIDTNPEQPPVYVYDWSSSEDMANWSLTSLSTNSIDTSFSSWSSLMTPSPEYVPNDESGENVETLAGSFILDLSPHNAVSLDISANRGSERRNIPESPTDHVVRRRRLAATRSYAQQSSLQTSAKRRMDTDDEPSRKRRKPSSARAPISARTVAGVRARRRKYKYSIADLPGTPEKLSETLRPSGSPTRVSGTKVIASVKFTDAGSNSLCKVDKSLVCKGFWETIDEVGRICLPRRSGKTYNLTQLLLFFSMSPELDYLEAMPDSVISSSGGFGAQAVSEMDVVGLCRKKRECLFKDSLLQTKYPGFFAEHFMKYPVLYISLSKCKGASFGTFIRALCDTFAAAIKKWIEEVELSGIKVSLRARYSLEEIKSALELFQRCRSLPASQMVDQSDLAQSLFQALSTFIAKQFGQYLLLIDEYDIPFISIHLAKWKDEDKQAALDVMKALFHDMLKDNKYLLKGLLFGVFEIPLTEMGSGANNIKDIRMIPAEESDIQGSILTAAHPHSGCGMDALTDSFWFNAHEVEQMLDNSTKWCTRIAKHKPFILQTIKKWYNGYYIGRFRGKYNPWSVSSFIEALCGLLSQTTSDEEADIAAITKSAARAYWVTTGTTGLIEAQIDRHRPQFIHLAKRLLRDYEATKSKTDGGSPDKTTAAATAEPQLPPPPPVPLVATRLNLINFDSELFSEPGLLTLCLYAGYLTRRLSTSVCIPNHEVYQVWLQLFARAVLGTELANNSTNNARGALLSELWENKTDLLCTLATSSHGVLSNHNNYLENDYANHVANTIMAVSRFGMLTHPKQRTVEVSHVVPTRENHAGIGKCDYTMRLFSSKNRPNQFGVVIEFKLIANSRRKDTAYHKERAEEGLRQIGAKNYDACLVGCLERMDVGMAIGNNAVYAMSRLYKRNTVDAPWTEVKFLADSESDGSY